MATTSQSFSYEEWPTLPEVAACMKANVVERDGYIHSALYLDQIKKRRVR
jgi:hypothetical protein